MATTAIWKITKRLDSVIKYIIDESKTIEDISYDDMHNNENNNLTYNTEKKLYVTGINCSYETSYEEMMITKKSYSKEKGILGYHAYQSFKEKEVTPELAHQIGIELANRMWGDRFEVVVSTHINTKNIHNHFVINSVSFKDGNKYYDTRSTYAELRYLSDNICQYYGLSTIKEKNNKKINYSNYQKSNIERKNYHIVTKENIDKAISQARSYQDFETLLKNMDYELIYRNNNLSVRRYPYKKNIRLTRSYGEDYKIDKIKERIELENNNRLYFYKENNINTLTKKHSSLYKIYIRYTYLLKKYNNNNIKKVSPLLKVDLKKLDMIIEEIKLLERNQINSFEQFFSYKDKKTKELETIIDKRINLFNKLKQNVKPEEKKDIYIEINNLTKEIKKLRKEVMLCKDIEDRELKVVDILKEIDTKEIKERREK